MQKYFQGRSVFPSTFFLHKHIAKFNVIQLYNRLKLIYFCLLINLLVNFSYEIMTDNVKVATISLENGTAQKTNGALRLLESEQEKKERMLSLKIVYFTMFLVSLGFSIVLTGIWPYLDKVRTCY